MGAVGVLHASPAHTTALGSVVPVIAPSKHTRLAAAFVSLCRVTDLSFICRLSVSQWASSVCAPNLGRQREVMLAAENAIEDLWHFEHGTVSIGGNARAQRRQLGLQD